MAVARPLWWRALLIGVSNGTWAVSDGVVMEVVWREFVRRTPDVEVLIAAFSFPVLVIAMYRTHKAGGRCER